MCLKVPELDKDVKYSSDDAMSDSCFKTLITWDSGMVGEGLRLLGLSRFEIGFVFRTNGIEDLRSFNIKEHPSFRYIVMLQ